MKQRLFFGMEAICPWPGEFPDGRILLEKDRHLTLAFLGDTNLAALQELLPAFPDPLFNIGLAGCFDAPLFLPEKHPRTAGFRVRLFEKEDLFTSFQERLSSWLFERGFTQKKTEHFLSHVTVARESKDRARWSHEFSELPLYLGNIHLYRSLGHSRYEPLWSRALLPPFEEREHTADLAFLIRGESWESLCLHALLALAFEFPQLLRYFKLEEPPQDFASLLAILNEKVARADAEIGCPFKAVTMHGDVDKRGKIWEWEMIVDV